MMRRVIVSGGPSPLDIRIRDSETGQDLTSLFRSFEIIADGTKLVSARLTTFVELEELTAETGVVDAEVVNASGHLPGCLADGESELDMEIRCANVGPCGCP